jgi:hypothetical protein
MEALPKWAVSNRESVEREAAPYRNLSPEERFRATAAACRSAARQLRARPDRDRLLAYQDRLSDESIATLRRLREAFRRR